MRGVRFPSGISREALACMIEATPYMTAATRAEPSPSSTESSSQVWLSRLTGGAALRLEYLKTGLYPGSNDARQLAHFGLICQIDR
ncbi:hypothetical protein GCM10027456_05570 [Kineosporia babensis]